MKTFVFTTFNRKQKCAYHIWKPGWIVSHLHPVDESLIQKKMRTVPTKVVYRYGVEKLK